jgi:hypothetical protein
MNTFITKLHLNEHRTLRYTRLARPLAALLWTTTNLLLLALPPPLPTIIDPAAPFQPAVIDRHGITGKFQMA